LSSKESLWDDTLWRVDDILKVENFLLNYLEQCVSKVYNVKRTINYRKFYTKRHILTMCPKHYKQYTSLYPEAKIPFFEPPYIFRYKIAAWGMAHGMPWMYGCYLWQNKLISKVKSMKG